MDKQDELAAVIAEAMTSGAMLDALCDGGPSSAEIVAAAVRSYLGSDEVVERVGMALQTGWDASDDEGFHGLPEIDFTPEERAHLARAALSAAGGGHG